MSEEKEERKILAQLLSPQVDFCKSETIRVIKKEKRTKSDLKFDIAK